jgi:hypothetical protein
MLPTFVIIGVMKCGTTSLHYYLAEHPEVCMPPKKKETDFFVADLNYRRGLAWYESLFTRPAKACGEASPHYAMSWQFPGVPERMHAVLPEAKLIYLVRDPLERMISEYRHCYAMGLEHRSLQAALGDEKCNRYVSDSRYCQNLLPFLAKYPQERLLVLSAEDLLDHRAVTLRRVFEFIGVDPEFASPEFDREWHRTNDKFTKRKNVFNRFLSRKWLHALISRQWNPRLRPLPPRDLTLGESLRTRLLDRIAPDAAAFRRLTGLPFAHWCV